MNVLFLSISGLPDFSEHSISIDLLHEFQRNGHNVYAVGALQKRENTDTYISNEAGCTVLRVKIGNNKKANIIEKGITTVRLPFQYISAIKKYFSDVKFDLVLYPTPPVTLFETVRFIKKRDAAKSYLLLKDIFPQNAVDIGMMKKTGVKGILYKYFRKKEKALYSISDRIGCMSQANVDYVIKHNPEINPQKVEVCPNSIEVNDCRLSSSQKQEIREKYNLPTDKKILIYGGNLGKPQGIPFLIDCLKAELNNSDAYYLIVGDGTEFSKLDSFFKAEQPTNMKLMKYLPKEEYDKLVAACDVGMIFLDHRFTIPNFPSRLLGYMQAGVPVLACTDINSDVGKVITQGGFGWWCESKDVGSFSKVINDIIASDIDGMSDVELSYLTEHYSVEKAYKTILEKK